MKLLGHKIAYNIFLSEMHVNRVKMCGKNNAICSLSLFKHIPDIKVIAAIHLLTSLSQKLDSSVRATHVTTSLRTKLSTISHCLVATSVLPSVDICVWFVLYEPLQSVPHGKHATLILSFRLWLWKEQEWRINLMTLEKCLKIFFFQLPLALPRPV